MDKLNYSLILQYRMCVVAKSIDLVTTYLITYEQRYYTDLKLHRFVEPKTIGSLGGFCLVIVEGTGYKSRRTSKVITKLMQFMLEGPQPCAIFSFTLTLLVE